MKDSEMKSSIADIVKTISKFVLDLVYGTDEENTNKDSKKKDK